MTTLNKPDVMPPIEYQDAFGTEVSVPVLAWGGEWYVAFCMRDCGTVKMNWYTNCSEKWIVTDSIKGWIPLPPNPAIEARYDYPK
jgi:hypothetical protein